MSSIKPKSLTKENLWNDLEERFIYSMEAFKN